MKLSKQEAQELVCDNLKGFKEISDEIVDTRRWSVTHNYICQHVESGKFYEVEFSCGATEQQDEQPFEFDEEPIWLTEVVPVEKIVTVYEPVVEEKVEE